MFGSRYSTCTSPQLVIDHRYPIPLRSDIAGSWFFGHHLTILTDYNVINAVFDALENQGLSDTVGILADESSTVTLASSESSAWLPSVADKIAAIAHHLYDYPDDSIYTSFVDTVQSVAPGKATWMSDICCGLGANDGTGRAYAQGFDPTITNALMSSGVMFQSFVLAGEPQFDFWTLVSSSLGCSPLDDASCPTTPNSVGWTDGLVYYDPEFATNNNFALYVTKHFWTFKHFGTSSSRAACVSRSLGTT